VGYSNYSIKVILCQEGICDSGGSRSAIARRDHTGRFRSEQRNPVNDSGAPLVEVRRCEFAARFLSI
jgi:hypothetical protein